MEQTIKQIAEGYGFSNIEVEYEEACRGDYATPPVTEGVNIYLYLGHTITDEEDKNAFDFRRVLEKIYDWPLTTKYEEMNEEDDCLYITNN